MYWFAENETSANIRTRTFSGLKLAPLGLHMHDQYNHRRCSLLPSRTQNSFSIVC
jgi:hypothetical protein